MNKPVGLRFIPKWLGAVIRHYEAGYDEFEHIIAKHDLKLYKVANNLLRVKLNLLRIRDFDMPSADHDEQFTEADALFALYGQNPKGLTVPQFDLSQFEIVPDKYDGIFLIERDGGEHRDLVRELLLAIGLHRGKDEAYSSDCFRRYLGSVSSENGQKFDGDEFHRRLKAKKPPRARAVEDD